jgi:hypothetical protein
MEAIAIWLWALIKSIDWIASPVIASHTYYEWDQYEALSTWINYLNFFLLSLSILTVCLHLRENQNCAFISSSLERIFFSDTATDISARSKINFALYSHHKFQLRKVLFGEPDTLQLVIKCLHVLRKINIYHEQQL